MRSFTLLLLVATLPAAAQAPLTLRTDKGPVTGTLTSDSQVRAFKGIPYAAPPVGPLRWQPPQPAAPWKTPYAAKDFGPHCYQSSSYPDMVFHDSGPSEDCLTLNVWTPATAKPGAKLPVMLWIYGGGFSSGSTSEARQDGQFLAHKGVIVVSMNYRLGIFGFFVHPGLTAESPHHASGNYGLLDQSAALAWVHTNIAAFGGDPANITLFGESAGSFSVSAQVASPLSRNLLAKAIGESGGAFPGSSLAFLPREEREQKDTAFARQAYSTDDLAKLRALTADELLAPIKTPTPGAPPARFGGTVDGYFLPKSVDAIYAAGEQAHIPLIAGWNRDEARYAVLNPKEPVTAETYKAKVERDLSPASAAEFLKAYPGTTDAEAVESASDYAGDKFIAFSTWSWLEAQVATGKAPVYRYLFNLRSPGDTNHPVAVGAFHSDDIEYVFGTLDSRPGITVRPEDRALSAQMQDYWTTFARTGNPATPTQPAWPRYAPTDYQVMRLDATSAAAPDTHRDRYLLLTRFYTYERAHPKP